MHREHKNTPGEDGFPPTVEQKDKENGLIRLPGLNKFMVISQSMAETLEGVTPEMLKSARKKTEDRTVSL